MPGVEGGHTAPRRRAAWRGDRQGYSPHRPGVLAAGETDFSGVSGNVPLSTSLCHVAFCATQEETFLPCSRRPEVPPAPGVMLFTAGAKVCVLNE